MRPTRRVAVLMELDVGFSRAVLAGIQAYAIRQGDWILHCAAPDARILPSLRQWKPDGIIAQLAQAGLARSLSRWGRPMVDVACMLPWLKYPVVDVDHRAVGRLAAEHFLDRGFVQFGFFGNGQAVYCREREAGFRQRLQQAGHSVSACHITYLPRLPLSASWTKVDQRARRWLRQLARPVAILASNDQPARDLADICYRLGLRVPEEVAILGVDNDELECRLASPPLSSIAVPAEQIGSEAARMLDCWIGGQSPPSSRLLLPPSGVVARQSTDTLACADPVVRAALQFIREHAGQRIGVETIVRRAGAGRRELERKFRNVLGRSILQELRRVRLDKAKQLLATTDASMPAIAQQCGFSNAQRFCVVFHQVLGSAPSAFRRQSRTGSP